MRTLEIRVHPSSDALPREDQLAWRLAEVAADPVPLDDDVVEAVIDRIIDNAAVAAAALRRGPVASARSQAAGAPPLAGRHGPRLRP